MFRKKNNGFTLVELIVVIVILAILVGVTIGSIFGYVRKARINTDIHNAKAIEDALQVLGSDEDLLAYANQNDISSGYSINLSWYNGNKELKVWRFNHNMPPNQIVSESQLFDKVYNIIPKEDLPKSKSGGHFHIDITSTAQKNGTLKIRCYACKEYSHSTGCTELKPVE